MQESNQTESKRLTNADWKALFDEWKANGMKQQQFFETISIKLHTFSYWRLQLVGKKKQSHLEDVLLEISNNRLERAIKPFALGRRNWLFANSVDGAKAAAKGKHL